VKIASLKGGEGREVHGGKRGEEGTRVRLIVSPKSEKS